MTAKGLYIHRSATAWAIFLKEEKPNKTYAVLMHKHRHTFLLQTEIHSHGPNYADPIRVTKKNENWVEYISSGLSGHDEVAGQQSTRHKDVPLVLQDILMHAEVLCWLRPKLGTAPRPAGAHNCDSTTCTNIHEVRA